MLEAVSAMASVIGDPYLLGLITITTILGIVIGVLPGLDVDPSAHLAVLRMDGGDWPEEERVLQASRQAPNIKPPDDIQYRRWGSEPPQISAAPNPRANTRPKMEPTRPLKKNNFRFFGCITLWFSICWC